MPPAQKVDTFGPFCVSPQKRFAFRPLRLYPEALSRCSPGRSFLPQTFPAPCGLIPAATENDSCIRWYKGRDCGPRSEQGIAAKAAPVVNEGPAGAVRLGRTGVRHKTAKKVSTFLAVGIRVRFQGPQSQPLSQILLN